MDPFAGCPLVTLEQVEAEVTAGQGPYGWLLPADAAFPGLPSVRLDPVGSLHLCQGRTLPWPDGLSGEGPVRAYDEAGTFLGLAEAGPDGRLRVLRLFVAGAGTSASQSST